MGHRVYKRLDPRKMLVEFLYISFVVTLDERYNIVNCILHAGLAMGYTSSYYQLL